MEEGIGGASELSTTSVWHLALNWSSGSSTIQTDPRTWH
jgi:hypothetical protein